MKRDITEDKRYIKNLVNQYKLLDPYEADRKEIVYLIVNYLFDFVIDVNPKIIKNVFQIDILFKLISDILNNPSGGRGIFVMATGGGKTLLSSIAYVLFPILTHSKSCVIFMDECLSNLSQSEEIIRSYLNHPTKGDIFHVVGNNSDRFVRKLNNKTPYDDINTTNPLTLKTIYEKSRRYSKHLPDCLLIFSTYASAHNLSPIFIRSATCLILDEVHETANETTFHSHVMSINAKYRIGLTATFKRANSDNGSGLNNVNKYGQVIDFIPHMVLEKNRKNVPYKLKVPRGYMNQHLRSSKNYLKDVITDSVLEAYAETKNAKSLKLLLCNEHSMHVKYLSDHWREYALFIEQALQSEYDISTQFNFASTITGRVDSINGVSYPRRSFLNALQDEKNYIICNHSILIQGIDIPDLAGIVLLRKMESDIELIQAIGRVSRPFKNKRYTKKYGLVIVPEYDNDYDNSDYVHSVIKRILRNNVSIVSNDNTRRFGVFENMINDVVKKIPQATLDYKEISTVQYNDVYNNFAKKYAKDLKTQKNCDNVRNDIEIWQSEGKVMNKLFRMMVT